MKVSGSKSQVSILLLLLLLIPFSFLSSAPVFLHNLQQGDSGSEVLELQKVLNSDPRTQIALTGPGSPGQETNYFGRLTREAVKKFQSLYEEEILGASGIAMPTGNVGPLTRAKLNSLVSTGTSNTSPLVVSPLLEIPITPKVFGVLPLSARPGAEITIYGEGFLPSGNKIILSENYVIENTASPDGYKIIFTLPLDIPHDSYNLWVENQNGSSFDKSFGEYFSVSNNQPKAPSISSISPSVMDAEQIVDVRIRGEGFGSGENIIKIGGLEVEATLVNDGEMLVKLPAISEFKKIQTEGNASMIANGQLILPVTLKNENGFSVSSIPLTINFQISTI